MSIFIAKIIIFLSVMTYNYNYGKENKLMSCTLHADLLVKTHDAVFFTFKS